MKCGKHKPNENKTFFHLGKRLHSLLVLTFEKKVLFTIRKYEVKVLFTIHNYEVKVSGCRGPVVKVFNLFVQGREFNPQSRHGGVGQIFL